MSHSLRSIVVVCTIGAVPLAAQNVIQEQVARIGAAPNIEAALTGIVRDSFTTPSAYEFLAIYHRKDHIGWGVDPAGQPGHRIDGCRAVIDDSRSTTANQFRVNAYSASVVNPAVPDVASRQTIGPFATPVNPAVPGQTTWVLDIVFPSPILLPTARDTFLGVEFGAEPSTDFLRIGFLQNTVPPVGLTTFDAGNSRVTQTGHGLGTAGGYAYLRNLTTNALFFDEAQYLISPMSTQGGFKVGMTTTQTSLPSSNPGGNPGFTTSLYSSRQPVMLTDHLGAARTSPDDLVMIYENGNLTTGDLVGFFVVPTFSGLRTTVAVPIPLPGWTGAFCLPNTIPPIDVGQTALDANGRAILPVPGITNAGLIGLDFVFTGIAVGFSTVSLHLGGCELVQF